MAARRFVSTEQAQAVRSRLDDYIKAEMGGNRLDFSRRAGDGGSSRINDFLNGETERATLPVVKRWARAAGMTFEDLVAPLAAPPPHAEAARASLGFEAGKVLAKAEMLGMATADAVLTAALKLDRPSDAPEVLRRSRSSRASRHVNGPPQVRASTAEAEEVKRRSGRKPHRGGAGA